MPRTRNRNKDYARGLANRQRGIFKKANTSFRFYGGDIGIIMKQNGRIVTYESTPGVLHSARNISADSTVGPDDFDTVADRQETPMSELGDGTPTCTPPRPMSSASPVSSSPSSLFSRSPSSECSSLATVPEADMGSGLIFPDSPIPFALGLPDNISRAGPITHTSTPDIHVSKLLPMPPRPGTPSPNSSPGFATPSSRAKTRKEALLALVDEFFL